MGTRQLPGIVQIDHPGQRDTADRQYAAADRSRRRAVPPRLADYRGTLQPDRRSLLDRFDYVHAARKVVGVGSVGTRTWIILLHGPGDEPLFLQAKEAQRSVLARYVDGPGYTNQGKRVVTGQRLIQAASDIFLGWQQHSGPTPTA